jgi:hypothetical protein
MKNDCKSELMAPFYGANIGHHCSGGPEDHPGKHYCGCSYEWTTDLTVTHAPDQATADPKILKGY